MSKIDYDRSRLNAEIAEMEAKRAAEARAREEAAEREKRGPVFRGAFSRIREGIEAGREEARAAREERTKRYQEYDKAHPSEYGKKIGRAVERVQPLVQPVKRAAVNSARAIRESQQQGYHPRSTRPRKRSRSVEYVPPPRPPARRTLDPLGGLDGMLIGSNSKKRKQKKQHRSDDDLFGLGDGFRLL